MSTPGGSGYGYKRYLETGENVNRQTRWRRSKQLSCDAVQSTDALCIQPQDQHMEDIHISEGHQNSRRQQQLEQNEDSTTCHESDETAAETEQPESPFPPDDSQDHGCLSEDDIVSTILAFSIRHGLSKVAMGDLLDLLRVLGVTENIPVSKYKLLKHVIDEVGDQSVTHFYCGACLAYVCVDETHCSECEAPFSKSTALKDGHFFMYLPLRNQLKVLLESGYIAEHMIDAVREPGVLRGAVDGHMYERLGKYDGNLERLTITWNFDGLPIYKSSGASLWPILAQINELQVDAKKEKMLICGLWFGTQKPLWATYSKPFMEELTSLGTDGIAWMQGPDEMVTKIGTNAIVCDSPARCMVQGIHQFNGAFGCTWCLQEVTVVPRGNGFARVYEHQPDAPKRTQANMIASAQLLVKDNLEHHHGVKTASPLLALPRACGVDVVRSFAVDYMHVVLLGIVRQFLELWFGSRYSSADFSIRGSLDLVDTRFLSARPPHDLSRTPRTLRDTCHWKASECRNWLLYYSVPSLHGIMPPRYLDHWCLLVAGVYCLLQDDITPDDIATAEQCLRSFSSNMETLYGHEHMSSNMHAVMHLVDCARDFGPLWASSAFPFEGYMMTIKQFFSGTTHLPQQVAATYLMSQTVKMHLSSPNCNEKVSALTKKWMGVHVRGERAVCSADGAVGLNAASEEVVKPRECRLLAAHGFDFPEGVTGRYVRRAVIGGSICSTAQHSGNLKRDSCTLFTKYGVGLVESICFVDVQGESKCFLFLKRCNVHGQLLTLTHMCRVSHTDTLIMCRPRDIQCNAVTICYELNGHSICVCAKQPNKVEKD